MHKTAVRILCLASVAALVACDDTTPPPPAPVSRVEVSPFRVTVPFSLDTVRLSAVAYDANGNVYPTAHITWSSSNPAVATVDERGLVTTVGAGDAEIIAVSHDTAGTALVIVDPGTPLENECMRCHTSTNLESHVAWGFPASACTDCHRMTVDDHARTVAGHQSASGGFDLLGVHATFDCTTCHESGTGTVLPGNPANAQDCIACHQSDYAAVHPAGWPTMCLDCHTTETWNRGPLDHAVVSGGFRLLGAHATLDCTSCHDPNTWATFWQPANDADCVACHQSDYAAQHPAGWPTTCVTCHTRDAWLPANFDHDATYFPIYSGTHAGLWGNCQACHTDVNDYKVFSCLTCHLQPQTDGIHMAVPAYQYVSTSCYGCHRDGLAPAPGNGGTAYRGGRD
jgi:hypothetical protein